MKKLSESKNIKFGVILSFVGMLVSFIGTLFISNRVLNYIGDYNYGLYSFVNSITSWLTVVSSALTASFLRYTTIESKQNDGETGRTNALYLKLLSILGIGILVVGLSITGIFYLSKVNLGKYNWNDSQLMYALFALSIFNIALTMPTSVFSLYINFKKKFVFGKTLSIIITILNFAGHFIIAYFTKNIVLITFFTIFITIFTFAMNLWFSKRNLGIKFTKATFADNKTLITSIIVFSSILVLNSIVDQINSSVDKTLLGIFSIPEDVTIYQMGQQFSSYLVMMSIAISGVFAPTMHQLVTDQNQKDINRLFLKISKIQTIILCLVTFGFMSFGYDFILWWIGPTRINAYYVGLWLMLIDLCPLTMNISIEIQRAENKHKFRAAVYFGVALVHVLLSILFLNIMPSDKAIFACLIGSIIARIGSHWIAMNIYNKKEIKLPVGKYMMTLAKYMIIGLIGFGIVCFLKQVWIFNYSSALLRLLIEGIIFVSFYGSVMLIIDRRTIFEMLRRSNL